MKLIRFTGVFLLIGTVLSASGAAVPGALPRHTLAYSPKLEEISVGLFASRGKRSVEMNDSGAETVLETESGSVLLGYDFASWMTGFTTLGAGRMRLDGDGEFADAGFKGSLGLNANVWRTDITHPEFLEGTLSFRSILEYKYLTSSGSQTDYEWNEFTLTFPLSFEMFTGYAEAYSDNIYSLLLYIGPSYSSVDGSATSGGRSGDFSEADNLGISTGADLYFSDNFALSCQLLIFEDTEIGAGFFYHF